MKRKHLTLGPLHFLLHIKEKMANNTNTKEEKKVKKDKTCVSTCNGHRPRHAFSKD
jgi:hypothetical protein